MAYADVIAGDGAIGLWPLDDGSGSTARGLVGPDGTYGGTQTFNPRTSPFSKCVGFADADATSDVVASITHGITTVCSLECWVFLPAASSGAFIKLGGESSNGFGVGVGNTNFDTSGTKLIGLYEGKVWIATTTDIPTDRWNHVVFWANGTAKGFFLNKTAISSADTTGSLTPNNSINLGGYNTGANRHGAYDLAMCAVYDKQLSQAEVDAHYDAGVRERVLY